MMNPFFDIWNMILVKFTNVEFLFNLFVKGVFILIIAGVLNGLFYRSSAAVKHYIWNIAFCFMIVLPVLNIIMPQKSFYLIPDFIGEEARFEKKPEFYVKTDNIAGSKGQVKSHMINDSKNPEEVRLINPDIINKTERKTKNVPFSSKNIFSCLPAVLFVIWVTGVIFFTLNFMLRFFRLKRIIRKCDIVKNSNWNKVINRFSVHYGIKHPVRVVFNKIFPVPAVFGFYHPVILLPDKAKNWPKYKKEVVLLHEFAHIKRLDFISNFIAEICCIIYWFNPLVWFSAKKLYKYGENACDDYVISEGIKNSDYAGCLLEIIKGFQHKKGMGKFAVAMARNSNLKDRFKYILTEKVKRNRMSRAYGFSLLILVVLIAVPVMTTQLKEKKFDYLRSDLIKNISDLKSGIPEFQKRAAWSLGEMENRSAVPHLIETLKDIDPEVRGMVAWALGEIKDVSALNPLLEALSDKNDYVREMIVKAIGEFNNPETINVLENILINDPNPDIRQAVVVALSELPLSASINTLAIALKDPIPPVRRLAVWAVAVPKNEVSVKYLLPMLSDPERKVRQQVVAELAYCYYPEVVDNLIKVLKSDVTIIRSMAAKALGKLGNVRAVEPLIEALQDRSADVRDAAVWALDEINITKK